MKLQGRVAVVTGAASGIGKATAALLAARGAKVVMVDCDAARLAEAAAEIGALAHHVVDVSNAEAVQALADAVLADHGGAHLLINNAGVTVVGTFAEHSRADWDRVMGVNFFGVLYGCQAFLPQLRAQDRGWIVNISSLFGLIGVPGQTAYCASKYAVRGFSEALYEELRGTNVGLSVVHPGGVNTRIIEDATGATGAPADDPAMGLVRAFFRSQTLAPAAAAAIIVAAVEAERHRVLVCRETYALDALRRLAPGWGNRAAVWGMERSMGLGALRERLKG